MHVDQVAAGQISSIIAAPVNDLALPGLEDLGFDEGILVVARRAGGEENGPASRENLGKAVGDLAFGGIKLGYGFWFPAGLGNAEEAAAVVGREDDVAILAPTGSDHVLGFAER